MLIVLGVLRQNTGFCHLPIRQWIIFIQHWGNAVVTKEIVKHWQNHGAQPSAKYLGNIVLPFTSLCCRLSTFKECDGVFCSLMTWFILLNLAFGSFPLDIYRCEAFCNALQEGSWMKRYGTMFCRRFCSAAVFLHVSMSLYDCGALQPWLSKAACHCNDNHCLFPLPMALAETNILLYQGLGCFKQILRSDSHFNILQGFEFVFLLMVWGSSFFYFMQALYCISIKHLWLSSIWLYDTSGLLSKWSWFYYCYWVDWLNFTISGKKRHKI